MPAAPAARNQRSLRAAGASARQQAEDHRAQRREEAERRVPAAVEFKRPLAREQVQEPPVERPGRIAVQVPVRLKSRAHLLRGSGLPAGRRPHRPVVKPVRRQRVHRKRHPVAGHDHRKSRHLSGRTQPRHQKQQRIPQPDLSQGVLKRPVGHPAAGRTQPHPQQHQHQRPPEGMSQHPSEPLLLPPPRQTEHHRRADQKGERRLNHVVQRAPHPRDVCRVKRQRLRKTGLRINPHDRPQVECLGQQQEHHKPPPRVERGGTRRQGTGRGAFRCPRQRRQGIPRKGGAHARP